MKRVPTLSLPIPSKARRWWVVALVLLTQGVFFVAWGKASDWAMFGLFALLGVVSYRLEVRLGSPWGFHLLLLGIALLSAWTVHQPQAMVLRLGIGLAAFSVGMGVVTYSLTYSRGLAGGLIGLTLALLGSLGLDGSYLLAQLFLQPVFLFLGLGLYLNNQHLEEIRKKLETAALTDSLTGLSNRRSLEESYLRYQSLAERNNQHLVLTLWDLDGLKRINDRDGHLAGDAHIRSFSQTLQAHVRPSDALFRISGDEFVGLHLGGQGEQLIKRVTDHFPLVSVGYLGCGYESLEYALAEADRRMYQHKQAKRRPTQPLIGRETIG
jgi:GGDEF domain-containing protein